jgi:SAM-dependent methyltransferase
VSELTPWQLKMFQKTLKKRIRLKELSRLIGKISNDSKCLLVTCGDNNGAMNYYLREFGGKWEFADLEKKSIKEMSELLKQEVKYISYNNLPYNDNYFDLVVNIDCHEHLKDPINFTKEVQRITKEKGHVIVTVPGGQKTKIANLLKKAVGMTKEKYGHVREGFSVKELSEVLLNANINPVKERTFSRFFTEMIELGINFLYVKVFAKKGDTKVEEGTIAPATYEQLRSIDKIYRFYSVMYPLFKLISSLDYLLFFTKGYLVVVEGEKN